MNLYQLRRGFYLLSLDSSIDVFIIANNAQRDKRTSRSICSSYHASMSVKKIKYFQMFLIYSQRRT
jgi:hypothetical protein